MKKPSTYKIYNRAWLGIFFIPLVVLNFVFYTAKAQTETVPLITSISPATTHWGNTVDILGSGFWRQWFK